MNRIFSITLGILALASFGQSPVSSGPKLRAHLELANSSIDTLFPMLATDSCMTGSTYYTLGNKIITGAAILNNGAVISRVGQAFDSGKDSISIGSVFAEMVYVRANSGNGNFMVEIFKEQDLQTSLGQSLLLTGNQLTDTSGPSVFNDFYFTNPVRVQGKFWVVLNVLSNGDSIYLASSGDDCGIGSAIFNNGEDWFYFRDQFTVGISDPLDIALKFGVVMDRIVGNEESKVAGEFAVYPNPAFNEFRLMLPDENAAATIQLRGPDGRVVFTMKDYHAGEPLQFYHLDPGIYLIELSQNGLHMMERLIVHRPMR